MSFPVSRTESLGLESKSRNEERKAVKKMIKSLTSAARQLDVELSDSPTVWMVFWGVGMALGTPKHMFCKFLGVYPVELRYYQDRSFCTCRFETPEQALSVYNAKNGAVYFGTYPVYVDFITPEPPEEDPFILSQFATPWPDGLSLQEDFISPEEEAELLEFLFSDSKINIMENQVDPASMENFMQEHSARLKHRFVRHFGYEFRYETNDVDLNGPIAEGMPKNLVDFIYKMMLHNVIRHKPEQITMNHYIPGQGIPPHVDGHTAFGEPIISLSLGSAVVMDFRNDDLNLSIRLPRRSLLVLTDEARYLWTHAIATRKYDVCPDIHRHNLGLEIYPRGSRVSLTFRFLNPSQICECNYPHMCDYQKKLLTEDIAPMLELDFVHKVYDEIASHFSKTRHTPWPRVKQFLSRVAHGQTLLDVGCGNGKYLSVADHMYRVGMDMSKGLLDIAGKKTHADVVRANCLDIPFRDQSFHAIICIAVLHHLSTEKRRLSALKEIFRVLAPGGHALIYVWAKDQKLKQVKSAYAEHQAKKAAGPNPTCYRPAPRDYSYLPVHHHEENFRFNDMLVPWLSNSKPNTESLTGDCCHRYYHVFNSGELEDLIGQIRTYPPPRIIDSYYDQGNWCVEIVKEEASNSQFLSGCPPKPISFVPQGGLGFAEDFEKPEEFDDDGCLIPSPVSSTASLETIHCNMKTAPIVEVLFCAADVHTTVSSEISLASSSSTDVSSL